MSNFTSDSGIAKAPSSPPIHESINIADQDKSNNNDNVQINTNKCLKREFAGSIFSDLKKVQQNKEYEQQQQQYLPDESHNEHHVDQEIIYPRGQGVCCLPHVDPKDIQIVEVKYADEENERIHNQRKNKRK